MTDKGIEEIFKSAFNNFEADVDPSVWTNVQQTINAPMSGPSNHGANGSIADKAGAVAGKLGVKAVVAIVTAVATVSVGTYFLLSDAQNKKEIPAAVNAAHQTIQIDRTQQTTIRRETQIAGNNTTANSAPDRIVSRKEDNGDKKERASTINNEQPQAATQTSTVASLKENTSANPVATKQPAPSKPAVIANSTSPVNIKENVSKTAEETDAAENHSYQNDFADINNYLEPQTSSGKIALPNIFTPNGDGKNDEFKINTKNLKSLVVTVFDMSGKLIYQWSGLDGKWDGNLSDGSPAAVGTYYYSLLAESTDGKRCIASSPLMLRR